MSNKGPPESGSNAFRIKQRRVAIGMAAGLLSSLLVVGLGVALLPAPSPVGMPGAGGLAFAMPWLAVLALPLAGAVAAIAARRFFDPTAMEMRESASDDRLGAAKAFLQNTLEQTVLAALSQMALASSLPAPWLNAVPVLAVWFVLARIAFRLGQPKGAASRAFGFAATFYPSVGGILVAAALSVATFFA